MKFQSPPVAKTGDHEVETKAGHARKFLEHNDNVQLTVTLRGREMQHQEEGRRALYAVLDKLAAVGKVERPPTLDGKKMTAMLMPIKVASKARSAPDKAVMTTGPALKDKSGA
jgi:translation initiation factor IF-3